jgi:hypothetical protein
MNSNSTQSNLAALSLVFAAYFEVAKIDSPTVGLYPLELSQGEWLLSFITFQMLQKTTRHFFDNHTVSK